MQTPGKSSGPSAPAKSLRRGVLNVDDGMRHVPSRRGRTLFAWLSGMRGHAVRRLRGTRTGALLRLRCRRPQRINAKMPTGQLPQDAGKTSSPRTSASAARTASAFHREGGFFRPYLAAIRPIRRALRQAQPDRRPSSIAKAAFFSVRILPRCVRSAAHFGKRSPDMRAYFVGLWPVSALGQRTQCAIHPVLRIFPGREHLRQPRQRPFRAKCAQAGPGAASRARGDKSINQVYSPFQPSFTVPSAPLRCLATMISAIFFSAVSGS